MADDSSLQIVEAIHDAIEATFYNDAISAAVYLHRVLSLSVEASEAPAVSVRLGADVPGDESVGDSVDSVQEIIVDCYDAGVDESAVITSLMGLRAAVHGAVLDDPTLDLDFVIDTRYGGADAPILAPGNKRVAGTLSVKFNVLYRIQPRDSREG